MKKAKFLFFFISVTILTAFLGCKDEPYNIPYVRINAVYYPNSMDYIYPGGYIYKSVGYKGIIIYRSINDEFMVYERACPYDPVSKCDGVKVDATGIFAVDDCCGTKYQLLDGSPISGPSKKPLMRYKSQFSGGKLYVTN